MSVWIPILAVGIAAFIIYMAVYILYPKGQTPSWILSVIWPLLFILLAWAGVRIWSYAPESIGRRVSFFIILIMLIMWPLLAWKWQQYGLATLSIIVAFLFTTILIIMMTVKDKVTSILLIPLAIWLGYASVLSFRLAKDNE